MRRLEHRQLLWIALIAVALAALAAGGAIFLFREAVFPLPPLAEVRDIITSFLNSIPVPVYFAAFVILPAFGAPLTLFYLTALPILGQDSKVLGVGLVWLALGLNLGFTHLLTHGIFHPVIERVLRHRDLEIPRIRRENEWKVVLATRTSPIPWALQNYLLALGHARWRYYLWLSLPIQAGIGLAMMLLGESVLKGGFGYVLIAIFLIVVVNLLLQNFRKRLNRESDPPNP